MSGRKWYEKQDEQDEIRFDNLIGTLLMNGKWEVVISFLTIRNDISNSLSFITVLTLYARLQHSISFIFKYHSFSGKSHLFTKILLNLVCLYWSCPPQMTDKD